MRINYNVSSIIARNALNNNDKRVAASTQRLSSGYKINSAADNAAGLAIARRMNAQIKSLQQANQSANDGLSALNTADGAMTEMHDILQRMNELAIQSANGTNSETDREMIQTEINELVAEIDRIADTTQYNSQTLLNGNFAYRAYANIDNAKVMSYTQGVATGTYAIGQLKYYHYKDTTTTYNTDVMKTSDTKGNTVSATYSSAKMKVTESERFEVSNRDDVLSKSLVKTTSTFADSYVKGISQFKTFPESSKVTIDEDNIVIKAQGNFEIKIAVNDRTPVYQTTGKPEPKPIKDDTTDEVKVITTTYQNSVSGATVVTTTSFSSVKTYRNIAVEGEDGERYFIKELNFFDNVDSAGNTLDPAKTEIYTGEQDDNCKDLKEDLAGYFEQAHEGYGIEINEVKYTAPTQTATIGAFKVSYTIVNAKTGEEETKEAEFKLYQAKNDYGNTMKYPKDLGNYLVSETQTTRTEYTIGNNEPDDCLKIDVTGMGAMVVQVGANSGQYMELEIPALNAVNLGVDDLDVSTEDAATKSIDIVGKAINQLSAVRSKIGAYSNRLEHTITNLDSTEENITASYSRIMDVDMATEMTEYSTVQILVQASTSMLAQANERPQQVLQLLQ